MQRISGPSVSQDADPLAELAGRRTCSIEEAAAALGISRVAGYRSAQKFRATGGREGLPVILLGGRRMLVPVPALRHWLETGLPPGLDEGNGNGATR